MSKYKKGPEFSEERRTQVLLEDLRSQFRVFGDGQKDVCRRLERIEGKVERLEGKVDQMDGRVQHLEVEMSFVMKVLPTVATKDDLKQFATKDDLKQLATKDDLKQMEKRLTAIETAR